MVFIPLIPWFLFVFSMIVYFFVSILCVIMCFSLFSDNKNVLGQTGVEKINYRAKRKSFDTSFPRPWAVFPDMGCVSPRSSPHIRYLRTKWACRVA